MPRRKDAINLGIQLTPEQYAALANGAGQANLPVATYVRKIFAENVPGFRDTFQKRELRGKNA